MATNNKEFLLGLLTEDRLRQLCVGWGIEITDQRLRAPGIAKRLGRKRSLDLGAIVGAMTDTECQLAATRMGVEADADVRPMLCRTLAERSWRAVLRENRTYDVPLETLTATVSEVIDGDTLRVLLDSESKLVRIRGIDAPESGPSDKAEEDLDRARVKAEELYALGTRSAEWLRRCLPAGTRVRLQCQPTPQGAHRFLHHRGHRLLAYVSPDGPDAADIGEQLLEHGLALVWPRGLKTRRYSHPLTERYVTACHRALERRPGLWQEGLAQLCPRSAQPEAEWEKADCEATCGSSSDAWR